MAESTDGKQFNNHYRLSTKETASMRFEKKLTGSSYSGMFYFGLAVAIVSMIFNGICGWWMAESSHFFWAPFLLAAAYMAMDGVLFNSITVAGRGLKAGGLWPAFIWVGIIYLAFLSLLAAATVAIAIDAKSLQKGDALVASNLKETNDMRAGIVESANKRLANAPADGYVTRDTKFASKQIDEIEKNNKKLADLETGTPPILVIYESIAKFLTTDRRVVTFEEVQLFFRIVWGFGMVIVVPMILLARARDTKARYGNAIDPDYERAPATGNASPGEKKNREAA